MGDVLWQLLNPSGIQPSHVIDVLGIDWILYRSFDLLCELGKADSEHYVVSLGVDLIKVWHIELVLEFAITKIHHWIEDLCNELSQDRSAVSGISIGYGTTDQAVDLSSHVSRGECGEQTSRGVSISHSQLDLRDHSIENEVSALIVT